MTFKNGGGFTKATPSNAVAGGCGAVIATVLFAALFMALVVTVMGIVLTWAWNMVLPDLLGWQVITAWQGIGITTLFAVFRMLLGIRYGGMGEGA